MFHFLEVDGNKCISFTFLNSIESNFLEVNASLACKPLASFKWYLPPPLTDF